MQVIDKIRHSPEDRRIVLTAWNPTALPEMALPPCHMFCQAGTLHAQVMSHLLSCHGGLDDVCCSRQQLLAAMYFGFTQELCSCRAQGLCSSVTQGLCLTPNTVCMVCTLLQIQSMLALPAAVVTEMLRPVGYAAVLCGRRGTFLSDVPAQL